MEIQGFAAAASSGGSAQNERLRAAAHQIEVQFLSTFLKLSEAGSAPDLMGGGIGEEQFKSFLKDAQATEISKAGGLGLAESLYAALTQSVAGNE